MRVAGIDVGSNSVRLLVADVEEGRVVELAARRVATRLGGGIGQGVLGEDAVRRTMEALAGFVAAIRPFRPERVVSAATSAVRDAANGAAFVASVRDALGLDIRVLTGDEEAAVSWRGVRAGLNLDASDVVVMDIGGGSTEFSWDGAGVLQTASVPAGAVRLTGAALAVSGVDALLAPALARIRGHRPRVMAGVGGTVTAACALKLGLGEYERGRLHGRVLARADVDDLAGMVAALSPRDRARLPGLDPERADIILAGLTIMTRVMAGLGFESLVASESGLAHGLVLTAG